MNTELSDSRENNTSTDDSSIRKLSDEERDAILDRYMPIAYIGVWIFIISLYFSFRTAAFGWPEIVAHEMEYFLPALFLLGLLGLLFSSVMSAVAWFKTRSEPGDYGYFYATWSALIRNHPFYKWRYVRWVLLVLLFIVCNEIILLFTFPETYPYATDPAMIAP